MTQSEQRQWFVGLLPAVSKGVGIIVLFAGCLSGCSNSSTDKQSNHSLRNVYPGSDIQAILDAVAKDTGQKHIKVHAGVYRPRQHGQALIWLNERHDGITLEAVGEVILTAANPEIANKKHEGFPAVVNHVVYFGDGITRNTVLRGFKITGANNYVIGSS